MRALITGACGFVGGHLARHLLQCGDEVQGGVVQSMPTDTPFATLPLNVTDVACVRSAFGAFKPDVVFHLAGMAYVPDAEEDFDQALRVNVGGTQHVVHACHLMQRPVTVVLVSSAEVYGRVSPEDLPITEETALRPTNNYSLTKLMAEAVAPRYVHHGQVRVVVVRPFNHIGPGQSDRFVASSFAHQLASMKAGRIPAIIQVGNLAARRDFSDVRDVVHGYRLAAMAGGGPYNFCSGQAVAIQKILDLLIEISAIQVKVEVDPLRLRPSDVPEVVGSFAKAQRELGWKPERMLHETLRDLFEFWYEKERACALS